MPQGSALSTFSTEGINVTNELTNGATREMLHADYIVLISEIILVRNNTFRKLK